jgi:hypothetical protein
VAATAVMVGVFILNVFVCGWLRGRLGIGLKGKQGDRCSGGFSNDDSLQEDRDH